MTWGFGKVILLGEHAVVYGHPALAGALGLGARARATLACADAATALTIAGWDLHVTATDDHPVADALRALLGAARAPLTGLALTAEVSVPARAGLGSSAALSVALARALFEVAGEPPGDDTIEAVANAAERCFHGTPSGVDVALATRGGLGLFRRGTGLAPLAAEPISIAIGLSGEPRRTADMVARVAAAVDGDTHAADRLDALGDFARDGADALAQRDLPALGALMNRAHENLASLGVSSPALEALVGAARKAGALGAKLTGAGGGGAVIACAPGREPAVCEAWRALGYEARVCRVGATAPEEP